MREAFVNVCGIPTHVMTWGAWIEESLNDVHEIVIFITGNPGLAGFYTEFLRSLHDGLGAKIPVWAIGHLGHNEPPEVPKVPQLKGNEDCFNLNGQIKHKIEFIEEYVPRNAMVHLVGHSIGAWMILQMLEHQSIKGRIKKCYLLFPTIERMNESPNGWIFCKIVLPLYSVFGFIIQLFNLFPNILQTLVVHAYLYVAKIPRHFIDTALKYTKPSIVEKVVYLAKDEMERVRELPRGIIENNLKLLKFFYGTTDGWVPMEYYKQLKELIPEIDAELDVRGFDHAFVLRYSQSMSTVVRDMIQSCDIKNR